MSGLPNYVVAADTVIISDILYYISNKLHNTPLKTVVTTCHSFYTDDDYVFNEKKKFCDATDELCSGRRCENKRFKNIEDICAILVRRDSQNLFIPKFASLNLSNVPINESGDPSLGQLMAAIVDMKKNMVTTEMLTSSFENFKTQMASSSTSSTSASSLSSSTSSTSASSLSASASAFSLPCFPQRPPPPPFAPGASSIIAAASTNVSASSPSAPTLSQVVSDSTVSPEDVVRGDVGADRSRGSGAGSRGRGGGRGGRRGDTGGGGGGGGGRREASYQNRRHERGSRDVSRSKTVIGKNVSNGLISFKGADLTINKYIGRVHNETSTEDLRQFITSHQINIVELEQLETKHGRFKSFRLRLKKDDVERMEDEAFWPKGIIFSPFFRPKSNEERLQAAGGLTASASHTNGS